MRWLRAVGGLLLITLLAAGCIKVEGDIKVEDDGSGNVDLVTALDVSAFTDIMTTFGAGDDSLSLEGFGEEEVCSEFEADAVSDVPENATVSAYNEDGFCGARIQYELPASTDHSALMTEVFDAETTLFKDGENWVFDTMLDTGDVTGEAEDSGLPLETIFGNASFKVVMDLPGTPVDGQHNADEATGDGKFTWNIDLLNPPDRLFAQTEPGSGGGGGGFLKFLIPLLLIGLLGLALFAFLRGRKSSGDVAAGGLDGVIPPSGTMPVGDGPGMSMPNPAAGLGNMASGAAGNIGDLASGAGNMASGAAGGLGDMAGNIGGAVAGAGAAAAGAVGGLGNQAADAADATKETVMINQQDVQAAAAAAEAAAVTPATPQPVYDEALGAWTVDDPARGRLRHDPATDTWNPI